MVRAERRGWLLLLLAGGVAGCADPCLDDGLLQDSPAGCPAESASDGSTGLDETESEGASCFNAVADGDESDVDCGGSCADRCGVGQGCAGDEDCETQLCDEGICVPPASCDDGVAGSQETDEDCGGVCGATCPVDGECEDFNDCETLVCDDESGLCAAPTCRDGAPNGSETDVDCGGPDCDPCGDGGGCTTDDDCASSACDESAGVCVDPSCADGVQGGDEADVDCGGTLCAPCEGGEMCGDGEDCLSEICGGGVCGAASCSDGVVNQGESDVDCGGPNCDPCDNGSKCEERADCVSELCDPVHDVCEAEACQNGVVDGEETDVDCGGTQCAPCDPGESCDADGDCASESCAAETCVAASCSDGVHNGNESNVDCGGDECGPCDDGQGCLLTGDCISLVCLSEVCVPPSCDDGVRNGDESDEDCGGSCGATCEDGETCEDEADCISGVCEAGVCAAESCDDGVRNGSETDVDCGGEACDPCEAPGMCEVPADCVSGVCTKGMCTPAACDDGIQNGSESDVDCGGDTCAPCDDGDACNEPEDCSSAVCSGGTCDVPTCSDGAQNQDETDVDCGGATCGPCDDGGGCIEGSDCVSEICDPESNTCEAASCDDGVLNGSETDVDCGGPACSGCDTGEDCGVDDDCASLVCDDVGGTCEAPTCGDGVQNQDETGIDCGGDTCGPCDDGDGCIDADDCVSMVCLGMVCQPSACDDDVVNGDETDVDCGGSCQPCDDGETCESADDCTSMVCDPVSDTCTPPACDDGVLNGDETDLDCGGSCGATCDTGESCVDEGDCASAGCTAGACNPPLSVVITPNACADAAGGAISYTAVASGGTGGPYTYAWSPDDGTVDPVDAATTTITPTEYASYTVTADDGVNSAEAVGVVVLSNEAFNLENNCNLYTGLGFQATPATIVYSDGGTIATEQGNNDIGLHLCEDVAFTNVRLTGSAVVNTGGDDDWFGYVWGAQDASNFYILSWKQSPQNFFGCPSGNSPAGIIVKRVSAPSFEDLTGADLYCANDTAQSVLLLGPDEAYDTGWGDFVPYTIEIDFRPTGSDITVTDDDAGVDVATFSISDTTYTSGFFGSHTLSQSDVAVGPLFGACL